ncbi:biotin carboxylase N-terminal domain-containing protein [Nocardioides sp. SYSU D00038]|uniref:ATP-binding protein n=1 Tax=Nocardioides sp. SYSU D00038 TaxID=2812554 RepID=UPI0019677300|nr:biotin carboxylase N-terminal domain-containing protein [Nocardioides sp. SYSU D00038]
MPEPVALAKVLVANRGEIALRVLRTCRRLQLPTVAVFTATDADAPHVLAADEAVEVAGYLDVDALVAAAVASGADAVHPGYGFLSERAEFAAALEAAGVRLVGPSAAVMEQMGRKDAAREIAVAAGVPVVPTGDDAAYPVLVKAAAGGGGKGMRIVRSEAGMAEALAAARREAAGAFGDDTMIVEKYVEHGRHIEVQVLADHHGNVVHLHERDCSAQRRHQKVVEEAPAPTISAAVRELVTSSAVALARHVGYTNAGTVEFLLDTDTDEAYFLEMNTRLQVEHPVTEAITGLDLVEEQLRITAGEPLRLTEAPGPFGHAIEARVYAEDPFHDFLPQAGTASIVRWPDPALARTDHALHPRQRVGTAYDPMLGKVVASGRDREEARARLVAALEQTSILGLTTNVGFLRDLVGSDEFRDATIDTAWLDTAELAPPDPATARLVAAWVSAMLTAVTDRGHPFAADGWRLAGPPAPTVVDLDRPVVVDRAAGTVDGVPVRELSAADHTVRLLVDGRPVEAVVNAQPGFVDVVVAGQRHLFTPPDRLAPTAAAGDGTVAAPMPGTVLDVRVAAGDRVESGQVLGSMEAMKMELTLTAPFAGTVASVAAGAGQQVPLGATLFVVEPEEEDEA